MTTVEMLHDEARAMTGLDDFGDGDHLEGLAVLLDSYHHEAELTPAGQHAARVDLCEILAARLLSEAHWKEYPEYARVRIERPVIVVGPPRTGTTNLHRLLAGQPGHQGLEFWLGYAPQPRPARHTWTSDPVFARVDTGVRAFLDANPGYRGIHDKDAAGVEECWLLTRQSLRSAYFEFTGHVPGYASWLAEQDMTGTYARHRRNLQLIGLHDQERRWILKYSGHLLCLDALLATYPDALVVVTHRRPGSQVLASACSMVGRLTAGRSTRFRDEHLGPALLDLAERSLTRFRDDRARHDPARFHDVEFDDFAADPVAVVEGIHDRLGSALDPSARALVAGAAAADERQRRHRYDLSGFGISAQEADERLDGLL